MPKPYHLKAKRKTLAMKKMKKRTKWGKFQFNSQDGSNSVPSIKSMKQASARLRKLRWKIYHERKKSKVKKLLDEYKTRVGDFLDKFKMRLKSHEVGIWKEKLSQTVKDAFSPRKAKANNVWHVNAMNVINSEFLKENQKSTPDIEMKLDEILLKLAKVQSLLEGKVPPSEIDGNTSPIRALDVKSTIENVEKAVDNALDEVMGKVSVKKQTTYVHNSSDDEDTKSTKHGAVALDDPACTVREVLDANPQAKRKRNRRKSIPVVSRVTPKGNTALDEEVTIGDNAVDAVDQDNPSNEESCADDAYASINSIIERNPVRNFRSRSVSERAHAVIDLTSKFVELAQSHPDEITRRLELSVFSYIMMAVGELKNAEVNTADEKMLVDIVLDEIEYCRYCML